MVASAVRFTIILSVSRMVLLVPNRCVCQKKSCNRAFIKFTLTSTIVTMRYV